MANANEQTWPQILRDVWNLTARALRVVPRLNTGSDYVDLAGTPDGNLSVNIGSASISVGGGTQYTEGDIDADIVGTAAMWEDAADTLRAVSMAKPLPVQPGASAVWSVNGTVAALCNGTISAIVSGTVGSLWPTVEATFGTHESLGVNLTSTSAWTLALATPSNAWRIIETINTTDTDIQVSANASDAHWKMPANSSRSIDLFTNGLKISTAISIRNDGSAPTRGGVYISGITT